MAVLRGLLTGAGFTADAVCARTAIESIYDFRSIREGRTTGIELNDRLDLLIRFANSASLTVAPETDPESRSEDAWLIRFPTGIYYIAKCDGQTHQWPD